MLSKGLLLWGDGAVTATHFSSYMVIPAVLAWLIPTALVSRQLPARLDTQWNPMPYRGDDTNLSPWQRVLMLFVGIGGLWFIPTFHNITKLSPFLGALCVLSVRYPQGGEKQLVDAVIQRQVPAPPAIPVNVGAIVQNVGTAYAVYEAVMKNKPLFERYTTVTGKKLQKPSNFLVRMGTPMQELIDACGGMPEGDNKLLAGGPMMGKALTSTEVPICKGSVLWRYS